MSVDAAERSVTHTTPLLAVYRGSAASAARSAADNSTGAPDISRAFGPRLRWIPDPDSSWLFPWNYENRLLHPRLRLLGSWLATPVSACESRIYAANTLQRNESGLLLLVVFLGLRSELLLSCLVFTATTSSASSAPATEKCPGANHSSTSTRWHTHPSHTHPSPHVSSILYNNTNDKKQDWSQFCLVSIFYFF